MHELCARHGVEQEIVEARELHAHRLVVELGADGILHPGIGDQYPYRREIRAERDEEGDEQVRHLAHPVPAEKEQTDEGRLEKERHQTLDRQWRAKDIADVVRVVRPVRAELEFQREAGGHPHDEIDAE